MEPTISERAARRKWTVIICGLLGIQLAMSFIAIMLATGDPRHSVVHNYHKQALHWNEKAAASHASQTLGWKWEASVAEHADANGLRTITIVLRDAQDEPINLALVSLQLVHHARSQEVQQIELLPVPEQPGTYCGEALLRHSGIWQLDLRVVKDQQQFIGTTQQNWQLN